MRCRGRKRNLSRKKQKCQRSHVAGSSPLSKREALKHAARLKAGSARSRVRVPICRF
jgi:hypothetical protein